MLGDSQYKKRTPCLIRLTAGLACRVRDSCLLPCSLYGTFQNYLQVERLLGPRHLLEQQSESELQKSLNGLQAWVGSRVLGASVGEAVVGDKVVGDSVGSKVVGETVVGASVGSALVGATVTGASVGAAVVGAPVGSEVVGATVVGASVGAAVAGGGGALTSSRHTCG